MSQQNLVIEMDHKHTDKYTTPVPNTPLTYYFLYNGNMLMSNEADVVYIDGCASGLLVFC